MGQSTEKNRRIVLASRPEGAPTKDNFRLEEISKPVPGEGELLLLSIYLSLDPYMRGRMNDAPSYTPLVNIDGVMVGATVCQIEDSRHPEFEAGEWVLSYGGCQLYEVSDSSDLTRLGKNPINPSYALGILGMPGLTACFKNT
jgi:NADPH-dependent curcumin reductase CurA